MLMPYLKVREPHAGAGAGQEDLCVWAVHVLPDGTMVSGDSQGRVQLWDANFGTLIQASP